MKVKLKYSPFLIIGVLLLTSTINNYKKNDINLVKSATTTITILGSSFSAANVSHREWNGCYENSKLSVVGLFGIDNEGIMIRPGYQGQAPGELNIKPFVQMISYEMEVYARANVKYGGYFLIQDDIVRRSELINRETAPKSKPITISGTLTNNVFFCKVDQTSVPLHIKQIVITVIA